MNKLARLNTIIFFLLMLGKPYAQTPFIRNYTPEEYKAYSQTWCIAQAQNGIMYFGNHYGVLEFDGTNWHTIKTPFRVCSIAIDSAGTIYTGLIGDFGYLAPDSLGVLQYKSLKGEIPQEHQIFRYITETYALGDKIIFGSEGKMFILQNNNITVFSDNNLKRSFVVKNQLYSLITNKGLFTLENGTFRLLPGEEHLSKQYICAMLPYGDEDILILSNYHGLNAYNPNKTPCLWKPDSFGAIDSIISNDIAMHGVLLPDGNYAIATYYNGIFIIDKQGKIQNHYHKQNGLQDNLVTFLFTDANNQLWATQNYGISHIATNLPFVQYTENDGLSGSVYSIQMHNNKLYVGTSDRLYIQNEDKSFESFGNIQGMNYSLLSAKGKLILGNFPNGLFLIDGKKVSQKKEFIEIAGQIAKSLLKNDNYIIIQNKHKGLALTEFINGQLEFKHYIKGFEIGVTHIEEDLEGNFWVNTDCQLYKLRLNETLDSVISQQEFTPGKHNLPEDLSFPLRLNNGEIAFTTGKGIYGYSNDKNYFEPHPGFSLLNEKSIVYIKQDDSNNTWFHEKKENNTYETGVLKMKGETYEIDKTPFYKFTDRALPTPNSLYPYSDSIAYFGTAKGLLEYHPMQKVNYNIPFNTLIRKILVNDSLVYGGASSDPASIPYEPITLKYNENNVYFHYAATFYEDHEKNLFSTRLLGPSGTDWSGWVNDSKKEYTNLHEGKYTFEVKSKNIYRKNGVAASFKFVILPPWYRTLWAYMCYGIALIVFIVLTIKIYTQRLIRQKNHLEEIVSNRTAEVVRQKEELVKLDQFKKGMTGMIVHDLKNPLSTILGIAEKPDVIQAGRQMLNMVLNILDVQKFEDAEVKLQTDDLQVLKLIDESVAQVKLLLDRKSIKVYKQIASGLTVNADLEIMNRVIVNILTNAIKYTPNNGAVTLSAQTVDNGSFVKILIADTGQGIPEDKLSTVFDKFAQVEAKKSGNVRSTGLGLTFCKMAVEAHGGEIGVESELGKGTTFWLQLPKGKSVHVDIPGAEEETNTIDYVSPDKRMSTSDIAYLKPFIEDLKKFTVYEFSDIIIILNKIEANEKPDILAWKTELENAVRACNIEKYDVLLKL